MAVLNDLSEFEFEDLMEDVFRNLGYENVRQAARTADEGRDVIVEEVVDSTRRAIVVECKHTGTVGRPVVQKLHSAIATFDFDGPKRGIVVTTGRFTGPVQEAFRDIENIEIVDLSTPFSQVTFRPVVAVTADTDAVFETSVGVIHRINNRTRFVVHAERGHPQVADEDVATLVTENFHAAVDLEADQFGAVFDDVKERRFGQTQTKYKEWAVERPRDYHTTTVTYTGDNNVTYDRTGEPKHSDISVQPIEPVYLTEVRQTTHLQECTYPYEYCAAGPSRVTRQNGIVDSVATFAGITYRSPLPRSARTNTGGSSSVYVPRPRVAFRSHLHVEFVDLNQAFEP